MTSPWVDGHLAAPACDAALPGKDRARPKPGISPSCPGNQPRPGNQPVPEINPVPGSLEINPVPGSPAHRLESGRWLTLGTYTDETEARIDPFDEVPLNVADWWPPVATES